MNLEPVGIIRSCYTGKFGIPRQPGLVRCAEARLELLPPFNTADALRGIEGFSHLWIIFLFHESLREGFQPTVRPPRLGGNARVGVFASRSPFRPNPIGLSAVELKAVRGTVLELAGGDFLDGTPVLDIKPYLPYADAPSGVRAAFAAGAPEPVCRVEFAPAAEAACAHLENALRPARRRLIADLLSYDPRPAYQEEDPARLFGTRLFDLEIKWRQTAGTARVEAVQPAEPA